LTVEHEEACIVNANQRNFAANRTCKAYNCSAGVDMTTHSEADLQVEIGHVLFIDIVGYSKLLIDEQGERIRELKGIVRGTEQFRLAEAEGKLLRLPTGDGGALVSRTSQEAPVLCALEISKALKNHPELRVRMGIHSGPVNEVADLNEQMNVAGAGINIAQRVMDCGDAGHILLSKHVAEDLEDYARWRPYLHELGECETKHSGVISVVNLYDDNVGNPQLPEKLKEAQQERAAKAPASPLATTFRRKHLLIAAGALVIVAIGLGFWVRSRQAPVVPSGKSIAVLPFENLSEEKANSYFADGVQDEILTDLAKIADLKVISRTSVMRYRSSTDRDLRQIAQQLGVAHVLEGSVQRSANRVRVSAQLIDARNDTHVWAEKYDRDLADVFAIQSEIAEKIADQLQAKLSPKEKGAINDRPTSDLTAYDLYLRAKELDHDSAANPSRWQENYFKEVQLLDQAIARDPTFLLAHCLLAYVHDEIYLSNVDHTERRLALAESTVRAAARLQPDAAETHLAQAIHFYWGYLNYDRAQEELAKAQQALPNNTRIFHFLGLIDRRRGRWDEAMRNLERAVDLDPRNVDLIGDLGETYESLHKYEDAVAMANRALALEPRSTFLRIAAALVRVQETADIAPARAVINTVEAEGPSSAAEVARPSFYLAVRERDPTAAARALASIPSEGTIEGNYPIPHAWYEGLLAKLRQDAPGAHTAFTAARAETEKLVAAQPRNEKPLGVLAIIDAELGDKERAIREGHTACDMLPPAKDAIDGVLLITNLARIYALTGEKDLALEQIAIVRNLPFGPSYGDLRLDPEWDSLHGDPRFEKIVASLAPKDISPQAR
jgi:TolB-like protein/class 3 adenylate cyclase/Flp pilus assembly protein TadD